jgi:hypothetical protein
MNYEELFWSKVKKGPDCWLWQGNVTSANYGQFVVRAHRMAIELTRGPIPDGMIVLHTCDNPRCVNPAHLWVGTHRENVLDSVTKGRWPTKGRKVNHFGESNPAARIGWKQVSEIRAKYKPHLYTAPMLAKEYGLSASHVSSIIEMKTWSPRRRPSEASILNDLIGNPVPINEVPEF